MGNTIGEGLVFRVKGAVMPSLQEPSRPSEVGNFDITPFAVKVFGHESTVAVMWLVLAAEETHAIKDFSWHSILHSATGHQLEKLLFVVCPLAPLLPVCIKHQLRRSQFRSVGIIDFANRLQEKPKVILLGEAGELGYVIQADIENLHHSRL